MPIKTVIAGGVSILGVLAMSAGTAFANGCFAGQNCNVGSVVVDPYTPKYGPVTIRNTEPLGHLRSVNFQHAPNVSITRVHGLAPNVALSDAPSQFTGGCNPSSTVYCRAGSGVAAPAPIVQAPVFQAPIVQAPIVQAPIAPVQVQTYQPQQPLRTWIGGGYDPSKFIPRQYGDNTLTPGIAHIPTSIVDRDPVRADQVLNSGRTIAQPIANGGVAPRSETYHVLQNAGPNAQFIQGPTLSGPVLSGPVFASGLPALPTPTPVHAPLQYAQPAYGQPTAPVVAGHGTFASNVGADGTYWEKTSGLTNFGDTVATQVICKRKLPTQVVHPVIGVPTPTCQTAGHGPHAAHNAPYGTVSPTGVWTH